MLSYTPYRGRFAPSPTGPLHYGSLVAAVASYLQARSHFGEWFIRIEDIDPAREAKGAVLDILQTLKDYGFDWDNQPFLQSRRIPYYKSLSLSLIEKNNAYVCECSRKDIAMHSMNTGPIGTIYPSICAEKKLKPSDNLAIRLRVEDCNIEFTDAHFGKQNCNLKNESGDFVIYRADELPSYIFAASLDDLHEGYTQIVRGVDLLAITPRQIYLTQLLDYHSPNFMHIPIVVHENGDKLSKQTHAPALKKQHARSWLYYALSDLGQDPPKRLRWQSLSSIWEWALTYWQPQNIPKSDSILMKH